MRCEDATEALGPRDHHYTTTALGRCEATVTTPNVTRGPRHGQYLFGDKDEALAPGKRPGGRWATTRCRATYIDLAGWAAGAQRWARR